MIVEKKWADPDTPMRLEDAITPVGTCTDMCPKFERYRREREHNLDRWEVVSVMIFSYMVESCADVVQAPGDQTRRPLAGGQDV